MLIEWTRGVFVGSEHASIVTSIETFLMFWFQGPLGYLKPSSCKRY